jgi:hypothetical protein
MRARLLWAVVAMATVPGLAGPPPVSAAASLGVRDIVRVTGCGAVRVDDGGVPRWLRDCGREDLAGGTAPAAREALRRLAPAIGLDRDGGDLRLVSDKRSLTGSHIRFAQVHRGVEVFPAQVVVALSPTGQVRLVNNGSVPHLDVDVTPAVRRVDAIAAARRRVPDALRAASSATLQIFAGPAGPPRLVWHVVRPTAEPFADWHVLVDARTGHVTDTWDELFRATGTGLAYDPNAVQTSGDLSLRDNDDATSPTLDAARTLMTLSNLDDGTTRLVGKAVDLTAPGVAGCNLAYSPGAASEPTRTYAYSRDDDRFEEVNVYASIDGIQSWFQSLGFHNVHNRPIPVNAHCFSADNSNFSPGDGALRFGDGGVDDAEDGDVVAHEYAHAVHHDQVPGWGPGQGTEQRAIGEGWGDFLAAMYYLPRGNPTYQQDRRYCVAEWDATAYNPGNTGGQGCLRWVNGTDQKTGADIGTYPGAPTQEHADGRFWSATMTCIFEGLGGDTTARNDIIRLILQHHFNLTPTLTPTAFRDSIDALIAEDEALFAGANRNLIGACAKERLGIVVTGLDATPPVISATVEPSDPDGSSGWYRTDVTVTWTVTDDESPVVSSNGCGQTVVTQDTAGTTFTCTATSGGGTASKSVTVQRDATAPTLAGVVTPNPVVLGQDATAEPNAADATSGVSTSGCDTVPTTTVGAHTVTCRATDAAGNAGVATVPYQVVFDFGGFSPPVNNQPTINDATAGSTIPVRFSLGGDQGLDVLAAGSPTARPAACDATAPGDPVEETSSVKKEGLRYDRATGLYTYDWKTSKSWRGGGCRVLQLTLTDGTTHEAIFRFK